ncbi:Spy/CpxP family protein refolding chaperone [Labrenzia sp. VG12]|uniref:Spy/CpxP family protein refolding chaperone n=1 Tax=Labrenzia sp. VG12 TaxID=2021862 RepID=UPI000B8BD47C|nr:Spy/CpxP family protein refolding chaperone [Labrenzia sp. VG12]ASP35656.1 hypothetical protein CHH27_22425 [Labrenzia sp. VG12]
MLHKLENKRLKSNNSKFSRLATACIVSTGILAGSVLTVNGAPQVTGPASGILKAQSAVTASDGSGLEFVGWRRGGKFQDMSDEDIEKRVSRFVQHVAIEIDATPEQIDQIVAILTPAAIEMKAVQKDLASTGKDLHELILAENVDRSAVEALRAEKLALADEVSRRLTSVMIDVAEVLTPEQRATLDERIEAFRGKRFGWRRH